MKKLAFFLLLGAAFAACDKDDDPIPEETVKTQQVSLSMQSGYANDIYFSLSEGVVSEVSRTEWDIAFYTNQMSSSILTNDGNGIKLYVVDAIANWGNIDTTGISQKAFMCNTYSDTTWEHGAFDKGAGEFPDYGWGSYNMTTHNVMGDSIHVIQFSDGSAKKLFIEKRDAVSNAYFIQYANLDGTNEVFDTIKVGEYADKNLIHYSISDSKTVSHEPASNSWDLLFTKYYDESIPYIVTGVLGNNNIMASMVSDVDTAINDFSSYNYSKVLNTIGSEWKALNHATYQYEIVTNLVYFVKDKDENAYKMVFTKFDGMQTGNIDFTLTTY